MAALQRPWVVGNPAGLALQRLPQVLDEILRIFDPHRVADKAIGDAPLESLNRRDLRMRHGGRVLDQSFHAPQRDRKGRQPHPVHEAFAGNKAPVSSKLIMAPKPHFIYIAGSDLVPEVNKARHLKTAATHLAFFVTGALALYLLALHEL